MTFKNKLHKKTIFLHHLEVVNFRGKKRYNGPILRKKARKIG
jgi:hypothetical protein